jgi:ERCC4-related helicase
MAPTRPLVAQQIEACFKIMGFCNEDISEMTGEELFAKEPLNLKTRSWSDSFIQQFRTDKA